MADNRAAIRDLQRPEEIVRYMRRRLEKRENTPGVSWDEGDHGDIRWALDTLELVLKVFDRHPVTVTTKIEEFSGVWRCAYCNCTTPYPDTPILHYDDCPWLAAYRAANRREP